jgi:hypothetical protein
MYHHIRQYCNTNMNTHTHPRGKDALKEEVFIVGDEFLLFADTTSASSL